MASGKIATIFSDGNSKADGLNRGVLGVARRHPPASTSADGGLAAVTCRSVGLKGQTVSSSTGMLFIESQSSTCISKPPFAACGCAHGGVIFFGACPRLHPGPRFLHLSPSTPGLDWLVGAISISYSKSKGTC